MTLVGFIERWEEAATYADDIKGSTSEIRAERAAYALAFRECARELREYVEAEGCPLP